MRACGLDFGTSNSAIGVMRGNTPTLAPVEGDDSLIPSAVFFDYENKGPGPVRRRRHRDLYRPA